MILVSIKRIFIFALQNFWRNIWLSVVTVTIMILCLWSIVLLGVLNAVSQEALAKLAEKIDIAVYLKPDLKSEQVENMRVDLAKLPTVKKLEVITADEAIKRFQDKHEGNAAIKQSLLDLKNNPFGATIIIKAGNEEGYNKILTALEGRRFKPFIQSANFDDYRRVIKEVGTWVEKLKNIAGGFSLFFLLITLLVVFNTIRMNIYTHREEIAIMRLVGASSWFIRAPFLVEGVIYAALATLLTAAIFFPLLSAAQPYVDAFLGGLTVDLVSYFKAQSVFFFGWQFVGASVLSILASTVAMRRYLKV